jgi:hypothetical protein
MRNQLTLLGDELKELGQDLAVNNVTIDYEESFINRLLFLVESKNPFTIDDIVNSIGLPNKGQNKNNAVGALMSRAAKNKLIKKIGYTKSNRAANHSRIITQWIGI